MNADFISALEQIEAEKGVKKEVLFEAIETALLNAYKKNFGSNQHVRVDMNTDTGDVKILSLKKVVADSEPELKIDEVHQSDIQEKLDNSHIQIGQEVELEITPQNFGRIAAQAARQMVIQKIKEAERDMVYEEFKKRESELIQAEIIRVAKGNVYVNLSVSTDDHILLVAEGMLTKTEQVPSEVYRVGSRLKVYILEVKKNNQSPVIMVSRSHPGLVKRLFEQEVPEIFEGLVVIKSIAREAGSRTKIAVEAIDEQIDPIGACVGSRGQRVKTIVDELYGEKMDIIRYSPDPVEFVIASISPAKVVKVELNEQEKSASVIVPDDKLSLAIGREGQNARLAARLTNWKVDISSVTQAAEENKAIKSKEMDGDKNVQNQESADS